MNTKNKLIKMIAVSSAFFGLCLSLSADVQSSYSIIDSVIAKISDIYHFTACKMKDGIHERSHIEFLKPESTKVKGGDQEFTMFITGINKAGNKRDYQTNPGNQALPDVSVHISEGDNIVISCIYMLSAFDRQYVAVTLPLRHNSKKVVSIKGQIGNPDFKENMHADPVVTFYVTYDSEECLWRVNAMVDFKV